MSAEADARPYTEQSAKTPPTDTPIREISGKPREQCSLAVLDGGLTEAERPRIASIIEDGLNARHHQSAARKAARKALAGELRSGRSRLSLLECRISEADEELQEIRDELRSLHSYPAIPSPMLNPNKEGDGLPETSGVYFLWSEGTIDGAIDYVGKSVRLNERLRLGGHHVMRAHHYISFLLFDSKILNWAECYYIGIVKPPLNFGGRD